MGCDIHPLVQIRKDGAWATLLPQSTYKPYDDPPVVPEGEHHPWLDRRCYALFGVLAGVRMDEFPPISEPRGLPADLGLVGTDAWPSDFVRVPGHHFDRSYPDDPFPDDAYWLGDHSHTWVTLAELLAYPWDDGNVLPWGSARQWCEPFCESVLPWLQTLGAPDDVRIVMGFDN